MGRRQPPGMHALRHVRHRSGHQVRCRRPLQPLHRLHRPHRRPHLQAGHERSRAGGDRRARQGRGAQEGIRLRRRHQRRRRQLLHGVPGQEPRPASAGRSYGQRLELRHRHQEHQERGPRPGHRLSERRPRLGGVQGPAARLPAGIRPGNRNSHGHSHSGGAPSRRGGERRPLHHRRRQLRDRGDPAARVALQRQGRPLPQGGSPEIRQREAGFVPHVRLPQGDLLQVLQRHPDRLHAQPRPATRRTRP